MISRIRLQVSTSDTTPPILSLPVGIKTDSTSATGQVTTDEGNGTLYFIATENATETAVDIKAGGSQAVISTAVQSVNFAGLTPGTTYYAHYVHEDSSFNQSNVVVSTSFLTDAVSSITLILSDISHSKLSIKLDFIQVNSLVVDDNIKSNLIDNLDLTDGDILSISDNIKSNSIDNLTLLQSGSLIVSDSLHSHLIDNIKLIDDSIPLFTSDGVVFVLGGKSKNVFVINSSFDILMRK